MQWILIVYLLSCQIITSSRRHYNLLLNGRRLTLRELLNCAMIAQYLVDSGAIDIQRIKDIAVVVLLGTCSTCGEYNPMGLYDDLASITTIGTSNAHSDCIYDENMLQQRL